MNKPTEAQMLKTAKRMLKIYLRCPGDCRKSMAKLARWHLNQLAKAKKGSKRHERSI